jgi:hypothetical protein
MPLRCESSITICFRAPAAQCVICGRHFCVKHGNVEASVCRLCKGAYRRKTEAEAAQQAEIERREMAEERNTEANLCGWYECPNPLYARCERCGLSYCPRHISRYRYNYRYRTRKGIYKRQAEVTLCDVCRHNISEYRVEKTWRD